MLDVAQTGGHKKRVRRSSFLNAKKLYEDAQMARKVKQYLSNLELEMDEESLQTLSLQCEPATNTRESPPLQVAAESDRSAHSFPVRCCAGGDRARLRAEGDRASRGALTLPLNVAVEHHAAVSWAGPPPSAGFMWGGRPRRPI